jgi:spore germination protein GerM
VPHIEAAARVLLLLATFLTLLIAGGCAETPAPAPNWRVHVYFNNDSLTDGVLVCDAVFPVPRSSPPTTNKPAAALEMLFLGPTAAERAEGYRSFFSERTAGLLKRVRIEAGTAYVDLHNRRRELASATSSCGSAEFFSQIQHTLRQFPNIERIIFAIEGKPDVFYDWMELECGPANDECDPKPFALP